MNVNHLHDAIGIDVVEHLVQDGRYERAVGTKDGERDGRCVDVVRECL